MYTHKIIEHDEISVSAHGWVEVEDKLFFIVM